MPTNAELQAEIERLRKLLKDHGIDSRTPEERAADAKRIHLLHREASRYGRGLMTGGHGYREGPYGVVIATYPPGSARANPDSWRCHDVHVDEFEALECALAEVKRVAAGGEYRPCNDGPSCPDEMCRIDWRRLKTGGR